MEARLSKRFETLDDYTRAGGGKGLERAKELSPDAIIDLLTESGLRGRGGAGFPTGVKWRSMLSGSGDRYVVCNAAEGEPATFKDRYLLRRNPYQVLEGVAIAAHTVGAEQAFVGLKSSFTLENEALVGACEAMRNAGMLDGLRIDIVRGPDRYLFGEETGLLGVIEGRGPFPREIRPFMHGLRASSATDNPTLVNNVETLANVPWILSLGVDWLRSQGTEESPGTMLFTVAGDVEREGVYELPLGTPLRELIDGSAGGTRDGRMVKSVIPGASSAVITDEGIDMKLDFDLMRHAGTGLGAGGFAVYDDSACMVEVARLFLHFLHVESCAQCPACKVESGAIYELVSEMYTGAGPVGDLEEVLARSDRVTDGQKCALPTGTKLLALSMIQSFAQEFAAHATGPCPNPRDLVLPKLVDYDEDAGRFMYDHRYASTPHQWNEEPLEAITTRA
ncbi:MAG: NADH-ubiquinone oxidoreductase-F iron-sulfur binding region domain-containing protein [Actinomycetota bacterium]